MVLEKLDGVKEGLGSFRSMIVRKGEDSGKKRIGLLIDGPNMLRKEFDFNLKDVKAEVEKFGTVKIGDVFLNQYAPDKLIEAVVNQGFHPRIVTSDDIDAPMAAEAMEVIFNPNIDVIALMTRDADFQTVLLKAKKYGKETLIIGTEPFASALRNTADNLIILNPKKKHEPEFPERERTESE